MKKQGIKIRSKTLLEQVNAIRAKCPGFKVTFDRNSLRAIGSLQPTARSETYLVEIKYRHLTPPQISVLKPELIKNFNGDAIPHIYPGEKLCLFYPKYCEFRYIDFISDTIIPWTSLWLYYYEDWHISGDWNGGGIHPKN